MDFKKISLKKRHRKKIIKKYLIIILLSPIKLIKSIFNVMLRPFKSRKQHLGFPHKEKRSIVGILITFVMLAIGGMVIFKVATGAINFIKNFDISSLFGALGSELPKDKNGFTNIMVLGIGGEGHDGGDLTDTIMLASIDPETQSIVLFSIPRDFWIETEMVNGRINEILRDAPRVYEQDGYIDEEAYEKSLDLLKNEIQEITGMQIDRYAKIDFRGFEKVVDALEGVDVYVEEAINDQAYPDANWGYEPFYLEKGYQHLDGKNALKYARSRHDSSDFARAARQQQVIQAIREKAISKNVLTSPSKIREVFDIVQDNFETDLSWGEILTLAHVGTTFPRDNIISRVLTDDEFSMGGFLVTPDRALYGGAFVLVPFLNLVEGHKFDQIRTFSDFIFHYRDELVLNPPKIEVKNTTNREGLARNVMYGLTRYGIPINEVSNSEDIQEETTIEYYNTPANEKVVGLITRLLDAKLVKKEITNTQIPNTQNSILIMIGTDFESINRIPE